MIKSLYRFVSKKWQSIHLDYPVLFQPRYGHSKPAHDLLYSIINNERETYRMLLNESLKHTNIFHQIKKQNEETDPLQPVYNNGFLPGLDIVGIYTIISHYKPNKYIEVGSGNSTKIAKKAITENKLSTQIISIDPQPRAEIDALADTIIRKPFETITYEQIFELEANDILFIDNSHRILPNSDAMVFFLEILPKLKKGVIVHVHDIYLPYDYPQFMCDRAYSEQYGLAMYLLANPIKYKPILPNYFISEDKALSEQIWSIWNHSSMQGVEKHGGSFWIQINE
jgi:hypothetical protein